MRDLSKWATPAAVLVGAAAIVAAVWMKPGVEAVSADLDPAIGEDLSEIRKGIEAMGEEVEAVRTEAARSRCELHRLNEQVNDPGGRAYLGRNGC